MTFRTELSVAPSATPLPLGARMLTVGSCFAAVLGRQLRAARLPVLENPFGTVLNPVAACRLLAVACGALEYEMSERAVERDGRWFSYDAPSSLSGATPEELHDAIEEKLAEVREFIRTADALVLTMGTAWVWRLDGEVVANCHKQPGSLFQKTLLSVQEIVGTFAEMHSWLLRLNPKLRVILTVSPVRHPKETLEGSSVSKATLRLACHHLAGLVRNVAYFPAYELLLDDLRDYRFFAADMLHPSPLAEEYIFGKFAGAWFDARFAAARTAWAEIDRALAHRSAHPQGDANQRFLLATLDRLDALAAQGFNIDAEVVALTSQLSRPRPAVAAVAGIRPIKPIIKVALPPEPVVFARIQLEEAPAAAVEVASTEESTPETPVEIREERRGGRRNNRRGRGGRGRDRERPPQEEQPIVQQPMEAVELPETGEEAEREAGTLASPDSVPAKKRRGRRGGRRHKQRRDEAFAYAEAGEELSAAELTDELQAGAEAAAELSAEEPVPEVAPEVVEMELAPAEEVALAAALPAEPEEPVAVETPSVATRKPARPARVKSAGGKKITLQKVKPVAAPVAEDVATAAPAVPEKPAKAPRPPRTKKPVVPVSEVAAPPVVEAPVAEPVAVVEPVVVEPVAPAPAKPESRTARTPGKARARGPVATPVEKAPVETVKVKGPVATPVEKAKAARVVKKAGVGALLAALGGAAPTLPPPPEPVAVVAPVVEEAAAAKPKRVAKPRTPKAK